jgi:hypothetical protein
MAPPAPPHTDQGSNFALLVTLLVMVTVLLAMAVVFVVVSAGRPTAGVPGRAGSKKQRPARRKHWVMVGAGLAAAAFLTQTHHPQAFVVAEASDRAGGRALTTVPPSTPVSTTTAPREFAAWIFRSSPGGRTSQFLDALGVQSATIDLVSPSSFIYLPDGTRTPFGTLPSTPYSVETGPQWLAHTGFSPAIAPRASEDLIRAQDLPPRALVPTGFGWQDVVLRGIGGTPVTYNLLLEAVEPTDDGRVALSYASGDTQVVDGVVLTLTPRQMLGISTLPPSARRTIEDSFVTVSEGVLYATWSGSTTWFTTVGFTGGVVATSLPVGRMYRTNTGEIRCSMTGTANVEFWNNLLVVQGAHAAAAAMAQQLREVFGVGEDVISPPDNMAFRGWRDAVGFWARNNVDRTAIQVALTRPWGTSAPIFWASSDLSSTPGWVEGAIESGQLTAERVDRFMAEKARS